MTPSSPLRNLHEQAEAAFTSWPPPSPFAGGGQGEQETVDTFGDPEAEYEALRTGCVLLDQPHRGAIEIRGEDRIEFLNRMITQELSDLAPWRSTRSFWLNRKGRIDADFRILQTPDAAWLDLDAALATRTVASLTEFVFAEDVEFIDRSEAKHRLALHGPASLELLRDAAEWRHGAPLEDLTPGAAAEVAISGRMALVERQDAFGVVGLELLVDAVDALAAHQQLHEAGAVRNGGSGKAFRAAGWRAANIARIEAGWPLHRVDFGDTSLPHESGVLRDRVSFTKGCYLGQEVVARLESLGKPKQSLVRLRLESGGAAPEPGAPVYPEPGPDADAVGIVTSAVMSPRLDRSPLCFAQVRTKHIEIGASLWPVVDRARTPATVLAPTGDVIPG